MFRKSWVWGLRLVPGREEKARFAHDCPCGFIEGYHSPAECHVLWTTGTVGLGHGKQLFAIGAQLVKRLLRKDQTLLFAMNHAVSMFMLRSIAMGQ